MKNIFAFLVFIFSIIVSQAQPTITSFSPTSGPVGTIDTIIGTGFSTATTNNIVFYGATRATVNYSSSTMLVVAVPVGATYQPITVTVSGLTTYSSKPFIITFTSSGSGFYSGSFASKVDFTTGTYPWDISSGDIDGDGKTDVVVVNSSPSTNNFSVFRNTGSSGTISFATKVDFATGYYPEFLAISDIDGDGKLDVLVANRADSTISIFRNTSTSGTLSFAARISLSTSAVPSNIVIGDLNSDGKPDIAVAVGAASVVSIFRNTSTTGSISFASKVDLSGTNPTYLSVGDIDLDGKPDVVVVNYITNTFSVFRNISSGSSILFATRIDISTGMYPGFCLLGDLDGDGKLEFINNSASGFINIFRNLSTSGTVSFASSISLMPGSGAYGIYSGDLDGDGKPDLAAANSSSNSISVFKNLSSVGTLTFASKVDFTTGSSPVCLSMADLDGDGKPDLCSANNSSYTISTLRNYASFLPVKLISFTATEKNKIVNLNWETASEINNDHFEVEMSLDNSHWSVIGKVKGNGTTNSVHSYQFADGEIPKQVRNDVSIVYYRLKQVDLDGKFEYSEIVSVNLKNSEINKIFIHPNPATNQLIISGTNQSLKNSQIIISDLPGRKIAEEKILNDANEYSLSVSELKTGIYFLTIQTGEEISRLKFVKE
ncbi:MAG: FG-GAP-like repeat-containing protein [Bacteroidia bacterium]